jgi:hypothetical protein
MCFCLFNLTKLISQFLQWACTIRTDQMARLSWIIFSSIYLYLLNYFWIITIFTNISHKTYKLFASVTLSWKYKQGTLISEKITTNLNRVRPKHIKMTIIEQGIVSTAMTKTDKIFMLRYINMVHGNMILKMIEIINVLFQ